MTSLSIFELGLLTILFVSVVRLSCRSRKAIDVLEALESNSRERAASAKTRDSSSIASTEWIFEQLASPQERRKLNRSLFILPLSLGVVIPGFYFLLKMRLDSSLIPLSILGLSVGYILSKRRLFVHKEKLIKETEYHLPVLMERIVMAVESGLDVIPAVGNVLDLSRGKDGEQIDCASKLLALVHRLCSSGTVFEEALDLISSRFPCSALRHAFVHLGLAHKEGGELIVPLRELSDATQLYYQETIEQEIAKMPVKATVPLVITFAGLIIFFLTIPIVQIVSITEKASIINGENYGGP